MNYSKAIRVARSLADLSQGQLADEANIDRSYLSLIESGKRTPSIETIEKIAIALKIPFHLLTLLGISETDAKSATLEQLRGLSLELTKLILQAPPQEGSSDGNHIVESTHPAKKSSRSRTAVRRKSQSACI